MNSRIVASPNRHHTSTPRFLLIFASPSLQPARRAPPPTTTWEHRVPCLRLDVDSHLEAVVRDNPAHHPIRMTPEKGSFLRPCAVARCFKKTGATGLEPATSGVTGRRSNQLNYAPGDVAV